MKTNKWMASAISVLSLTFIMICGCGKKSYIDVSYTIPDTAKALSSHTLFVETKDLRQDTKIFKNEAEIEFQHFTGLFSLRTLKKDTPDRLEGAFDLTGLFKKVLIARLEQLNLTIADTALQKNLVFQIVLTRFQVGLAGRKWTAQVDYEVNLIKNDQIIARETVSGSAERTKIMGTGGADKVVSEIFTEIINRLNIHRLFQQTMM